MRILSKYILKESVGPFLFGFSIITLVLVMDFLVDIMNLIISRGVKPWLVIEMFALNLARSSIVNARSSSCLRSNRPIWSWDMIE